MKAVPQREDYVVKPSHNNIAFHNPLLNIGRLSATDAHTRIQAYVPPPRYPWLRSYAPTRLTPWSSTADLTPGCRAWTRSAGEWKTDTGWLRLRMVIASLALIMRVHKRHTCQSKADKPRGGRDDAKRFVGWFAKVAESGCTQARSGVGRDLA